jgi:hypothetical protein
MRRTKNQLGSVILILIVAAILYILEKPSDNSSSPTPAPTLSALGEAQAQATAGVAQPQQPAPGGAPNWGVQTKTSGCQYTGDGKLPDPACTPGDLMSPRLTREQICISGYSSSVRNVTDSTKNKVYAEYGITSHASGQYEVDHFVSLELGGSNDISNLFPEPASPKPGFHEKDKVENYLHDQVCSGAMTLQTAQIAIATNWLDVYDSMPDK